MKMNYLVKIKMLAVLFLFTVENQGHAVTSKEVFSGKGDWIVLNGVNVRKGTINATAMNILELDKLLTEKNDETKIEQIIIDQKPLSRGLHAAGYFEMQPIHIFLKDAKRQGRVLIAVLTMQDVPNLLTEDVLIRLKKLREVVHPILQREIDVVLDRTL